VNDLEDQIRAYADAISADRPTMPTRRPTTSRSEGHRAVFLVASVALIVVLLAGALVATRNTDSNTPASAIATAEGVTTQLEISDSTPDPGEIVTATLTIVNDTDHDIGLRVSLTCYGAVTLSDPTNDPGAGTGRSEFDGPTDGATDFMYRAEQMLAYGPFSAEYPFSDITFDHFLSLLSPPQDELLADISGCDPDDRTIRAGEERSVELELAVGSAGLEPGPGEVSTSFFGSDTAPNVTVPITIPPPPEGKVTRTEAFATAIANPDVAERIRTLPSLTSPSEDSEHDPTDVISTVFIAWPIDDGWEIGYADSSGAAFLTRVSNDAEIEVLDIR
jgi:hypothetical protein